MIKMAGKLYAYTDTRAEAQSSQRSLLKKGIYTLITKEYGGYAVRGIPKSKIQKVGKIVKRKDKRKTSPPFGTGLKISMPKFKF